MRKNSGSITLVRTTAGWSARFRGQVAEEIRTAFGTDTIPTAFTSAAAAGDVQQSIQAGWPKCSVTVQEAQ